MAVFWSPRPSSAALGRRGADGSRLRGQLGCARLGNPPFWAGALLAQLVLAGMAPSDDIWRCMWEEHIQRAGLSPYALAPDAPESQLLRTPWWDLINHPGTSAIYPPLAQLLFRFVAMVSTSVLAFKLLVVSADLAVCGLLTRQWGRRRALA